MKELNWYFILVVLFASLIYWSTNTDWTDIRYWIAGLSGIGMYWVGYAVGKTSEEDD